MTKRRESFCVTITQHHEQSNRRKVKAKFINEETSDKEQGTRDKGKYQSVVGRNNSFGYFPDGCSWIGSIKFPVEIAVECHGSTAGKDHAEDN